MPSEKTGSVSELEKAVGAYVSGEVSRMMDMLARCLSMRPK